SVSVDFVAPSTPASVPRGLSSPLRDYDHNIFDDEDFTPARPEQFYARQAAPRPPQSSQHSEAHVPRSPQTLGPAPLHTGPSDSSAAAAAVAAPLRRNAKHKRRKRK